MSSTQRTELAVASIIKPGSLATAAIAGALLLTFTTGCSSKNYVKSQTAPLVNQTNNLDAKTASDHRTIVDTDDRAQKGIAKAQGAADTADQHAMAAGQSADTAGRSAQEAYNRVDTLNGVIANLDNYKSIGDVSVTFGFDKSALTANDKKTLDDFAAGLADKRSYILAVTGGTDSTGDANYNYGLSQRRADAVVNYLATKYGIAPHKFYLIGIGKDQQVATDATSAGRAKNRRVEVKLMTNMDQSGAPTTAMNAH
ncbi:MAG: OmpA family protein [Edaphobacter sp.]|uniref:OmpA family protein n=1 Tax=Edaphobacter sp. TaxID=1934404 RepID=UPI00239FBEE1|nr:OmpA family protein [Edaphobacter sp.]MDE1175463.1 OmpA family protein [Edaphobacter sp.]